MKRMLLLLVVALCIARSDAQVEVTQTPANEQLATFDVDAMSFASDSAKYSRLTIFAAIPYELLSFVKRDDQFVASYEMTVTVLDSTNALLTEKLWTREVKVPTFEQSVSSAAYSIEQPTFLVPPGLYQLVFLCRDIESRVTRRVTRALTVFDYSKPGFKLSDIVLVNKFSIKDGKRSMTPSITPNVGNIAGPLHIFFEGYNESNLDSAKFSISIYGAKNESIQKSDTVVALTPGKNAIFLRVDQSALPIGDYKMYVQAYPTNATTDDKALATTSRYFIVRWAGMPKGVKDLDLAIEQLTYIAKDKELDHIKEAKTAEEKQKRFLEFWKKKDPNPNTIRNEKMEEHYSRVDYANRHFKHYSEGWRTDMGMVYIIFGTPNNVDRHPFDSDAKPYEVWAYYELNYSFVFVDQTGFGDYRLTTPIWEVWQRPRN